MDAWEAKHQAQLPMWKERIAECRSSGMSVRQWCLEHGISPTTYYRWEREALSSIKGSELVPVQQIQPVSEAAESPAFVEIPSAISQDHIKGKPLCLRRAGYELEIPAGTDLSVIRTILEAMGHAE